MTVKEKRNEITKRQTLFKFTQDWLIKKTNTIQIIRKCKNLIKFPDANLPINE